MSLYAFHAFLISTAIVFFAGFSVYCLGHGESAAGSIYPIMGGASALVAVLMTAYLVYFVRVRLRRQDGTTDSHP